MCCCTLWSSWPSALHSKRTFRGWAGKSRQASSLWVEGVSFPSHISWMERATSNTSRAYKHISDPFQAGHGKSHARSLTVKYGEADRIHGLLHVSWPFNASKARNEMFVSAPVCTQMPQKHGWKWRWSTVYEWSLVTSLIANICRRTWGNWQPIHANSVQFCVQCAFYWFLMTWWTWFPVANCDCGLGTNCFKVSYAWIQLLAFRARRLLSGCATQNLVVLDIV